MTLPPQLPEAPEPEPRPRRGGIVREVVETLVITLLLFVGIQTFLAQPFEVEGLSMERTFEPGQYVLIDKLTPRFTPYHRGDVVVFRPPDTVVSEAPFIKRVIGVAGDTVEVRADGRVLVNGTVIDEPYVFDDAGDGTTAIDLTSWTVGDGQLFVLGDHRNRSEDSRVFGVITLDHVVGRAFFRYWPLSSLGVIERPSSPPQEPGQG